MTETGIQNMTELDLLPMTALELIKDYLRALRNTKRREYLLAFAFFCVRQTTQFKGENTREDILDVLEATHDTILAARESDFLTWQKSCGVLDAIYDALLNQNNTIFKEILNAELKYLRHICPPGKPHLRVRLVPSAQHWESTTEFVVNSSPEIHEIFQYPSAILSPYPAANGCHRVLHVIQTKSIPVDKNLEFCPKVRRFKQGEITSTCIGTDGRLIESENDYDEDDDEDFDDDDDDDDDEDFDDDDDDD
jgi:hypothetical protein